MKIKFLVTMIFTFLLAGSTIIPSFAAVGKDAVVVLNIDKPTMLVNGAEKKIDLDIKVTPILVKDTTFVPISAIIESFGGGAKWDNKEKKVTISYNNKVVELWLNKNEALVNGTKVNSKVAPKIISGRTMVPLKFVSENLGLYVNWEGSAKAISISASNDYVAVVYGEKINKAEYNIFLSGVKNDIISSFSQNSTAVSPEGNIWDTSVNGIKAETFAKQMALDYSKQQKIYLLKAKENKVILSKEEVESIDSSIAQMIQQSGGNTSTEKMLMDYYNVNLSEYTEFLKEIELVNKYLQGERKKIVISDDDIIKAYENNKLSFDKVTVKHILISTISDQGTALSIEKQEEAKKKADDLLLKVKAGEDFATLVKQYSEDPGSIETGGEYTFGRGEMVKEFEDWSFQAKAGDVGIVKTAYGYHVMKFVAKSKSTFEDVKSSIRDSLTSEAMNLYVKQLFSDTKYVVIKNQSVYDAIVIK